VILACYLVITALSLSAWIEFWAAAVILSPLVAFLPIVGFSQAGFAPLSFLVSSAVRIAAISLIAAYGSVLLTDSAWAIPEPGEDFPWLQAFVALCLSVVMLMGALGMNQLLSGVLMGRPGWAGGLTALYGTVQGTAAAYRAGRERFSQSGLIGGTERGGGGGGRGPRGPGPCRLGGAAAPAGTVQSTQEPVNSRRLP
jgi:hypothetical protein